MAYRAGAHLVVNSVSLVVLSIFCQFASLEVILTHQSVMVFGHGGLGKGLCLLLCCSL